MKSRNIAPALRLGSRSGVLAECKPALDNFPDFNVIQVTSWRENDATKETTVMSWAQHKSSIFAKHAKMLLEIFRRRIIEAKKKKKKIRVTLTAGSLRTFDGNISTCTHVSVLASDAGGINCITDTLMPSQPAVLTSWMSDDGFQAQKSLSAFHVRLSLSFRFYTFPQPSSQ